MILDWDFIRMLIALFLMHFMFYWILFEQRRCEDEWRYRTILEPQIKQMIAEIVSEHKQILQDAQRFRDFQKEAVKIANSISKKVKKEERYK